MVELNDYQLNFLARLKLQGRPLPYDYLGDTLGNDSEAIKQLTEMSQFGFVNFDGSTAHLTSKGLDQVQDRNSFFY